LEIGSGLGFDGMLRLQEGLVREWTFCDIVETNLQVIQRICKRLGVRSHVVYIDDKFECFSKLGMFDVVWANGSLLHVPFELARSECIKILPHLNPGGRWIELGYPRERWIREGRPSFVEWGRLTDGERTPWVEWYDLVKIKRRLFPAPLDVVLNFNFSNDSYTWFDLVLASDHPFDPNQTVLDLDVYPPGPHEIHGDGVVVDHGDTLEVITPEPIWSYATSFDIDSAISRSNKAATLADDGFTIEVEVLVTRGYIGVLVEGNDALPICQECMVAADSEPKTMLITIPAHANARRIVFRNTAAGAKSHFALKRVILRLLERKTNAQNTLSDSSAPLSLSARFFRAFR
jgi:hypothetical protein